MIGEAMPQPVPARAALVRDRQAPLSIEPILVEPPRATELRVRMVGSGICHTDLVFRASAEMGPPTPCVLGHEGAGVVEAVGSDVDDIAPDDHVVLSFASCGKCANCRAGALAYCENMAVLNYSGGRADGSSPLSREGERVSGAFFCQSSFATYAVAERRNAVKVPHDIPLEILGPLGCGIQTGAGAVMNVLRPALGASLVIFGGGAVGLAALLAARSLDAGAIVVVEPHAHRRALALELGATEAIEPSDDIAMRVAALSDGGAHAAIDTTGLTSVIAAAGGAVRARGTIILLGMPMPGAMLPIDLMTLLGRGLTVRGVVEGDADPQVFIPQLIELYRGGRFPFDRLIRRYPFEQINDAIEASASGAAIKPVLTFA